ncbi:dimethylaniline monooxygenase [Fusarium phyllophilum]|uniref:Dimethylaniline monooxygenase n=1 Tax=Fusarium phyllophilum TaxID=47803 RepID=A0A8H5IJF4_9HYPO|nr:dimethylaniline monooxygenase [Fusarium phyllophilum]
MPYFEGSESFGKPLFHAKEFCSRAYEVKDVKNAIVVGGAKSAYDVAYAMVDAGAQVNLIVKLETNGPVWIAPRWVTPLKARIDKTLTINYDNYPETKKLKPWYDVFWISSGLSILNFNKDFFDLVCDGKIRVHIDNVKRLKPG